MLEDTSSDVLAEPAAPKPRCVGGHECAGNEIFRIGRNEWIICRQHKARRYRGMDANFAIAETDGGVLAEWSRIVLFEDHRCSL